MRAYIHLCLELAHDVPGEIYDCRLRRHGREQEGKFVTGEPGKDSILRNAGLNSATDFDQEVVAYHVPPGVIDTFEFVEIEEEDGSKVIPWKRSVQAPMKLLEEQAAVWEAGQFIAKRENFGFRVKSTGVGLRSSP
jgi:hypothetical protein